MIRLTSTTEAMIMSGTGMVKEISIIEKKGITVSITEERMMSGTMKEFRIISRTGETMVVGTMKEMRTTLTIEEVMMSGRIEEMRIT